MPPEIFDAVDLWWSCKGEVLTLLAPIGPEGKMMPFPAGRLPGRFAFAGGAADQPSWLADAFEICAATWEKLERAEK